MSELKINWSDSEKTKLVKELFNLQQYFNSEEAEKYNKKKRERDALVKKLKAFIGSKDPTKKLSVQVENIVVRLGTESQKPFLKTFSDSTTNGKKVAYLLREDPELFEKYAYLTPSRSLLGVDYAE